MADEIPRELRPIPLEDEAEEARQARIDWPVSTRSRQRVYARDGWCCVDCGRVDDLTLDHVTPLAVRVKGSYSDKELATRCRRCNSRRGPARTGERRPAPEAAAVSRG
jgi:5-methylcytosine-specific restriction endonuclease McrA